MTKSRIPVWIDCDPGNDDAVAILLALYHPSIELIGISTTHGNASLEHTTNNALMIMSVLHSDVPVYSGSVLPLVREPHYATNVHGWNGLGGIELPITKSTANAQEDDQAALDAMYDASVKYKDELALVAIGPLTNVYKLFQKHPDSKHNFKVLSIMGGGIHVDNVGNGAEFNFYADPHAANYVLSDAIVRPKIVLVPLDVTHTVLCTEQVQKQILGSGEPSQLRKMYYDLMMLFAEACRRKREKFAPGPPVHDPVAVHVLMEIYGFEDVGMKYEVMELSCVETGQAEGKVEWVKSKQGSKVVFNIDVEKFWADFLEVLVRADRIVSNKSQE